VSSAVLHDRVRAKEIGLIIIGIDPHKRVHTASAVDATTNQRLASVEIDASLAGYRRLKRWAEEFSDRRWAVENAHGLGRHLAQWLVARGERVDDVASTATARVRELSRGGRRKNDVIDAAAAASVAALQGDANPVLAEDAATVLVLLDERRDNVITQRTRLVNQLHALLRDLIPGGAPTDLTAASASRLLAGVRPAGPVETARKQLARDLVTEIRAADQRLKTLTAEIAATVAALGSRLTEVNGIGPVVAARLAAADPGNSSLEHERQLMAHELGQLNRAIDSTQSRRSTMTWPAASTDPCGPAKTHQTGPIETTFETTAKTPAPMFRWRWRLAWSGWRWRRDLNPRRVAPHALSRRAL
jgi:hypothetical protein